VSIYVPTLPTYGRLSIPSEERFGALSISPITAAWMQALGISSAQAFGALVLSGGLVVPTIPDGVYPMGFQGLVKGVPANLRDLGRSWNFNTDGLDLSGWRIHGMVGCAPNTVGINGITGDGFEIVGADNGTSANGYIDTNGHFTGAKPNFQHFTIQPNVPVKGTNGISGAEFGIYDFKILDVGGDQLSPNNMHNGYRPLNITADWGFLDHCVYYLIDQVNGTHNDNCQIPGGTVATFSRIYGTGITHPTLGDGHALRTVGPNDGSGPRLLGQQNSSFLTTQNVSPVGDITWNLCRFGGGWYGTINLQSTGNAAQEGPITITNSLFDGNDWDGYDIIVHPNVNFIQSGNARVDGHPLVILHPSS